MVVFCKTSGALITPQSEQLDEVIRQACLLVGALLKETNDGFEGFNQDLSRLPLVAVHFNDVLAAQALELLTQQQADRTAISIDSEPKMLRLTSGRLLADGLLCKRARLEPWSFPPA